MANEELNIVEETPVTNTNTNFFISLFSADGKISSKRVGGMFLLLVAGSTGILSLFKELSDQALELNSTLGWMSLTLLGVNIVPEFIKAVTTKNNAVK